MTMVRSRALVAAAVVVAAVASAPTVAPTQSGDIVAVTTSDASLSTFTRAIVEAGLSEVLRGPGPFTVLAPTDAAFQRIPKASLDALLKDKSALRDVLLSHVIAGRLTSQDFLRLVGRSRKTMEGSARTVGGTVTAITIGTAMVTRADIVARNGIVHTIDHVLLPPPVR
jgi:uncharacterized surface protein with fasciclin (FAS1) repeats